MASIGSSVSAATVGKTVEQVENVSIPTANIEVSHSLPSGTKSYKIQNRDTGLIKLAFSAATSGTTFWTIGAGQPFETDGIDASASITLFMQSPAASQTVEIWSSQ